MLEITLKLSDTPNGENEIDPLNITNNSSVDIVFKDKAIIKIKKFKFHRLDLDKTMDLKASCNFRDDEVLEEIKLFIGINDGRGTINEIIIESILIDTECFSEAPKIEFECRGDNTEQKLYCKNLVMHNFRRKGDYDLSDMLGIIGMHVKDRAHPIKVNINNSNISKITKFGDCQYSVTIANSEISYIGLNNIEYLKINKSKIHKLQVNKSSNKEKRTLIIKNSEIKDKFLVDIPQMTNSNYEVIINNTKINKLDLNINPDFDDYDSRIIIDNQCVVRRIKLNENLVNKISHIELPPLKSYCLVCKQSPKVFMKIWLWICLFFSASNTYIDRSNGASERYHRLYEIFSNKKSMKFSGIFYSLYFYNQKKDFFSRIYWWICDAGLSFIKPTVWLLFFNLIIFPMLYDFDWKYTLVKAIQPTYEISDQSWFSLAIISFSQLVINITLVSCILIALRNKFKRN